MQHPTWNNTPPVQRNRPLNLNLPAWWILQHEGGASSLAPDHCSTEQPRQNSAMSLSALSRQLRLLSAPSTPSPRLLTLAFVPSIVVISLSRQPLDTSRDDTGIENSAKDGPFSPPSSLGGVKILTSNEELANAANTSSFKSTYWERWEKLPKPSVYTTLGLTCSGTCF